VNRPASVKPDNFFLLIFHALRQRRVPITLRIAIHSLLLVALALLIYAWVMGMQFKQAMHQQADAVGQSLTIQTATSATDLLVANDVLSLNVLLSNLVKNPLVAHAAIYSIDGRVLAEAGTRPKQNLLGETEGLFSTPITFQEVIAGQLRLTLDMHQFRQPMTISLQSMGLLSLILLLLTLTLSLRLGRHVSTPLLQLRVWLRDPDDPAPGAGRQDEIGDLARQLQARLVPEKPEPEPYEDDAFIEDEADYPLDEDREPDGDLLADDRDDDRYDLENETPSLEDEEDDPFSDLREESASTVRPGPRQAAPRPTPVPAPTPRQPRRSAVLAVQLGGQEQLRRLPRSRLLDLLQRYRACLDQAATLYKAQLHTLNDGSSLLLFNQHSSGPDYLIHALCCGELLRALGHALQIEIVDSGLTLQLQLGLTLGEELDMLSQGDLLLSETAQDALALSLHSRNLLLIQRRIADDPQVRERARVRPIASPEGACCVERLLDPYPALLERQLARMQDARATQ
jgi:uncharacterized membrane protein affecting hemolysin expression